MTPILLFSVLVLVVYFKQDAIVKDLIKTANQDFEGTIRIKDSHIAPFANFPYISIDIEKLEVYEGKEINKSKRIVHISDVYIGFDVLELMSGKYDVKSVKLSEGEIRVVQDVDGNFNIVKAFESKKPIEDVEEEFHLDLKSIKLNRIDVSKLNEQNGIMVDAYISEAQTRFKSTDQLLAIDVDSKFELNLIKDRDTSFLKHKHFEVNTEVKLDRIKQVFTVAETEITLENASFNFEGDVDLKNDLNVDLHFSGRKSDFNLFLAFAPEELEPTLRKFENKGTIFFDATVKGKAANGTMPKIYAQFGCDQGYFNNLESGKKLDKIGFKGSFTNGSKRNLSTMRFVLENFTAKPDAGIFKGKLAVENFNSPEIDMKLSSDFDLDFLSKFLNTPELKGLSGRVNLDMNFHDIIDIEHPEKSIERLNESYFTELSVEKLKFKAEGFNVPIDGIDIHAIVEGHEAKIDLLKMKLGNSDLNIKGSISDLPAIIHHTSIPVTTDLRITSKLLDIEELTSGVPEVEPIDEQIENLSLNLKFLSSAKNLTESPSLPLGEFFITDLYAKMKHYPHTLHDFHADIFVEKNDFKVVDFSGMIDKSDFHFSGKLRNYNLWFEEKMQGETQIEFDLTSKLLQLDNLFTYGGERYVPEDYRHEEVDHLKIHCITDLHFHNGLKSTDFYLSELSGKMKVHPLRFENFKGNCHVENGQLKVKNFTGKIGHSTFNLNLDYALVNSKSGTTNQLIISGDRLDLDELLNYNQTSSAKKNESINHDDVFSIYDFNFPAFNINADVKQLNYHNYKLRNFKTRIRLRENHMIHLDELDFVAAEGKFDIKGYLSGKDKEHIYFNPIIKIDHLDLDKFMVKFDNFGQDHLVSENLHGIFSGEITGKIHLHADLVPKIDDSELNIKMTVLNGKLQNYSPILALGEYFEDHQLKEVRFDTLSNTFNLKNSNISIPEMTINSSLGFLLISGNQKIDEKMNMEYLIGVPWRLITNVAGTKLFGRLKKDEPTENEIQYRQKNSKFLYVRIKGDPENYSVSIGKKSK